jgi:hypothetical protein
MFDVDLAKNPTVHAFSTKFEPCGLGYVTKTRPQGSNFVEKAWTVGFFARSTSNIPNVFLQISDNVCQIRERVEHAKKQPSQNA